MGEDNGLVKILIVDDDDSLFPLFKERLSDEFPASVIDTSSNPVEALGRIKDRNYTLVLSDFNMPEMSGAELCIESRKIRPDIPFVIMSGLHENGDTARKLNADFLKKPYLFQELLAVIRKYVHSS